MPSVLIIILNWNGLEDTIECVNSLLLSSYENYKILVIDNGSVVKPDKNNLPFSNPNIIVEYSDTNLGFANGVNKGIKTAQNLNYEYVALINNDATVDIDWLKNLVVASSNSKAAICCGVLLNSTQTKIDSAGELFSIWGISSPRKRGSSIDTVPESSYVFGATGGAVLYKTSLFKEIGLFDGTFFAYYEDADINFRSQLAGHKAYYTNTAIAYHKQGASSNKVAGFTTYQTFKNIPLLFWKNVPTQLVINVGFRFLMLYVLILGNSIKNGSGLYALKGTLASIWYFWTSAFWKRLKIQKNKKVSANYIWSILYKDLPPEQTGMRKLRSLFYKV